MADKKFPHEQLLEDATGVFSLKDLSGELQTAIKVFNMHKGKKSKDENGIKSLQIAQDIEKWMEVNGYTIEEEDTEPAPTPTPTPAAKSAAEIEAERIIAEKAAADAKAAEEAAAAQKAADDAKAAEEAAAAQKAAADATAAEEKAAADAEAARLAAIEEEKKKDPKYGKKWIPLVGWVKA